MSVTLTRSEILKWVHLLILAVGLNAGNFSIDRVLPFEHSWPDQLFQIRYLCIPILLILAFMRRPMDLNAHRKIKDAFASIVILGGFLIYALFRVPLNDGFSAFYSPLEPYFLVFVYALLTMLTCRDRQDVGYFLKSTLIILVGVLGLYIVTGLLADQYELATKYYYSRMFYVGFIISLMVLFDSLDRTNRKTIAVFSLAAFLFLFAGVTTGMRSSLLLYTLSILAIIPLLLALRSYSRLAIILLIAVAGYGFGLNTAKNIFIKKAEYYSPFVSQQESQALLFSSEAIEKNKIQCQERIALLAATTREKLVESDHSCASLVSISDADARIRLLMTSLSGLQSIWVGNGLGTYSFVDAQAGRPALLYKHPHNVYAELLNEAGVIGLMIIALSLLFVLSVCARAGLSDSPSTVGLLSLIPVFFILSGAIAGDFYDARYIWIMPIIMAALMAGKGHDKENSDKLIAFKANEP